VNPNYLFNELQNKDFDWQPTDRLAAEVVQLGEICDLGCSPGHIARYYRNRPANEADLFELLR